MAEYETAPLGDALGIEVTGLELNNGLAAPIARQLDSLLARHLVVVIRDQDLEPQQMLETMSALGPAMRQHYSKYLAPNCPQVEILASASSELREDGKRVQLGASGWHSDHINHEKPPKCTILHAKQLPENGGDTSFANMRSAYRRLSNTTRQRVERMRTVNALDNDPVKAEPVDRQTHADFVIQPMVRTHPVTAEHALYFHSMKLDHIEGMSREESLIFLQQLQQEAMQPDLIYRHQWRVGDLLLIDNRACMHLVHDNYDHEENRIMYRLLIQGDKPYFRPVTRPTYN